VSDQARGGGRRSWAQAFKTHFKQLDQNMPKNAYFLEQPIKAPPQPRGSELP